MLGAGPAGLAAALRLLALGHTVALVERRTFPRPNIGEALTPGVHELLASLEVADVLRSIPIREELATVRLWEGEAPEYTSAADRGPGVMVDRGAMDRALLERFRARGGVVLGPAEARAEGNALFLAGQPWRPAFTVDARGRGAPGSRVATGVPALALWVDDPVRDACEMRLEAVAEGWLWSAPLATGGKRTLAMLDPARAREGAARALASILAGARLIDPVPADLPVQGCDATASVCTAEDPPGWYRAGDAAFTLDPLSSTGVERALRGGLQAALAVHTRIGGGEPDLVADFLRARVAESVASHHRWTAEHYLRARPDGAFWRARRRPWHPEPACPLMAEIARQLQVEEPPPPRPGLAPEKWWGADLRVSPEVSVISVPCVVDDEIRAHAAVRHPGLARPVAFLGNHDVAALLGEVPRARRLRPLIEAWSHRMSGPEAARLAAWLIRHGLVEQDPDPCGPGNRPCDG